MSPGGDVPLVGPQEELRGPSVYFQGFYFEPTTGGEVRIFGFYTNEQTNKNFRALPRELDGAMQSFKNAVLNAALAYTS